LAQETGINAVESGEPLPLLLLIFYREIMIIEQGLEGDGEYIMRVSRFIPDLKI
jgi:hypothetical protein